MDNLPDQAQSLHSLGLLAYRRGDDEAAEQYARRSLAAYQEIGAAPGVAKVSNNLGAIAFRRGRYAQARTHYERALAAAEQATTGPGSIGRAYAWAGLGRIATALGETAVAAAHFARALRQAQRRKAIGLILDLLPGTAVYLAEIGERALAQTTLTHVATHPAAEHFARQEAKSLLAESGAEKGGESITTESLLQTIFRHLE
jgi:tetratricopeptide (TPR) repeat protein